MSEKDKLEKVLLEYKEIINNLLIDVKGRENLPLFECVLQNFLRRNYYVIKTLQQLFPLYFDNDVNYKFSIGLILRPSVLDYMYVVYIIEEKNKNRNIDNIIAEINYEFVEIAMKDIDDNSNENIKNTLEILNVWFPQNFENKIDTNNYPKMKRNLKKIKPIDILKKYSYLKNVHYTYKYFSQYEHYSFFSNSLFVNNSTDASVKSDLDFEYIKRGLSYSILSSHCCFHYLDSGNSISKTNLIGLLEELENI